MAERRVPFGSVRTEGGGKEDTQTRGNHGRTF
jgi:hypothetical protein